MTALTPSTIQGNARPAPTFFVAGAAKAGTTSLHRYLGQHPDVFMTETKEPHFFTKTLDEGPDSWRSYLDRFQPGAKAEHRGESTPGYLYSGSAQQRIREALGKDVRFVVCLRDPVERSQSEWWMAMRRAGEERGFAEALENGAYVDRSMYGENLERLEQLFGREQLTILSFGDLVNDTEEVIRRITADLGLDPCLEEIETDVVHNPGGWPISKRLYEVLESWPVRTLAQATLPRSWRIKVGEHLLQRTGDRPELSQDARQTGMEVFRESMQRAEKVIGEPMPELRRTWT